MLQHDIHDEVSLNTMMGIYSLENRVPKRHSRTGTQVHAIFSHHPIEQGLFVVVGILIRS